MAPRSSHSHLAALQTFFFEQLYTRYNDRAFLSLLGSDGKQWLSLVFWQYSDLIQLWAYWDAQWMKLGDLEDPKLGYWHHICVAVCPSKGELRAFMEGLDMGGVSGKNVGKIPRRLELVIGKWTTSGGVGEQFHGSVTNVQVFASDQDTKELSRNPCSKQGDLLLWNPSRWFISGDSWLLQEWRDEDVCKETLTYPLAFHLPMGILQAMDLCKKKLDNGFMPSFQEAAPLQVPFNHTSYLSSLAHHRIFWASKRYTKNLR